MHVQVGHLLNACLTRVGDQAKAIIVDVLELADLADGARVVKNLGVRGGLREMIIADIGPFRDHQNMHRRLCMFW